MNVTPARIEDIESILAIEMDSFVQPWGRRALIDELKHPQGCRYIARSAGSGGGHGVALGYVLARFLLDEMHLMKLAVAPPWRQRGIATVLLDAAQQEASRRRAAVILLEVRPSNAAAVRFYRRAGFQVMAVRPNYYPQTGEDALVMSKRLEEES